jgi:hypothetical protein
VANQRVRGVFSPERFQLPLAEFDWLEWCSNVIVQIVDLLAARI